MIQRKLFLILLLYSFVLYAQNLPSGGRLKPEQAIMDVRHYTLALEVNPQTQTLSGYTEVRINYSQVPSSIVLDLWHGLTVTRVLVNGKPASFQHTQDDVLKIDAQHVKPGNLTNQTVRVYYNGKPGIAERPPWIGGFQWEKDSRGNPWVAITCQNEGGKIFFPCKDHPSDEPDEGADLLITVPKGLVAAGPGLLISQKNKGSQTTFHWRTQYPISNYCLVFNIGKFKKVSRPYITIAGNTVPMDFYVLEEHEDKAQSLLTLLEESCRILEKYFGEYPWVKEKIGICETPHLGMEHQTLNAYGNKFRYTKINGRDHDWLLVHEFGHEWWANKITNRDWAHMWIQEGICSFADALHLLEKGGPDAYRQAMQRNAWNAQNKLPIVQGEEINSDQAYHSDIYGKGAFFMHTLRYVLGDDVFFPALKKLATDPRYVSPNTVTTDDVEQLFSSAYGRSLKPLFDLYLRTTQKLDIQLVQTGDKQFRISLLNLDDEIPVDIVTSTGRQRMMVGKNPKQIISDTLPQIDPDGFYLKRLLIE
ncbi:MAG: M1 family metallopeptidase [Cyclobacteriaceae bacterium]|nr:M1 family metallopeptidase [Cyclobacteriaceae bacterium]